MSAPALRTRRWSRLEYEQLIDLGVFKPDEHLELIDGVLVVREPRNAPHATAVRAVHEALRAAFGAGWDVRPQRPLALDNDSEPEPDVSVVSSSYRAYRFMHPARPVLVVEVSAGTLAADRRKGGLYARAAVDEYWIVNRADDVLEVYRRPELSDTGRFRWVYADTLVLRRGEVLTPLAKHDAQVRVEELLLPAP
jgi:Uma2 family endonuclease